MNAWIETTEGGQIPLEMNCYFGRSHVNTVQLKSLAASRRHALIHHQHSENGAEYWLVDLGSTNGTLCNSRRITIPCRLKDGDAISILGENFTFRRSSESESGGGSFRTAEAIETVKVRARQSCWMLMLDIKRFTVLSQQLDADTLGFKIGQWLRQSRDILETSGGVVDKFLGDAIFAYWKEEPGVAGRVVAALREVAAMQQARDPDFRLILHHGEATLEGGAGGADNLSGPDVIQVFRMEKVCSKLEVDSLLSEKAVAALAGTLPCSSVGSYPLDGFSGVFKLYRLDPS